MLAVCLVWRGIAAARPASRAVVATLREVIESIVKMETEIWRGSCERLMIDEVVGRCSGEYSKNHSLFIPLLDSRAYHCLWRDGQLYEEYADASPVSIAFWRSAAS